MLAVFTANIRWVNSKLAKTLKTKLALTGETARVILRWDDRWGGASIDLDIYLWDTTLEEFVAGGEDYQTGQAGHIPSERVRHELVDGRQYDIVVVHRRGRVPDWVQVTTRNTSTIQHHTRTGSINNPSESANSGMLAVGAAHYWNTNSIADYSSRGPTPDGRVKPEIVGTACAQTASYELRPPGTLVETTAGSPAPARPRPTWQGWRPW